MLEGSHTKLDPALMTEDMTGLEVMLLVPYTRFTGQLEVNGKSFEHALLTHLASGWGPPLGNCLMPVSQKVLLSPAFFLQISTYM